MNYKLKKIPLLNGMLLLTGIDKDSYSATGIDATSPALLTLVGIRCWKESYLLANTPGPEGHLNQQVIYLLAR